MQSITAIWVLEIDIYIPVDKQFYYVQLIFSGSN